MHDVSVVTLDEAPHRTIGAGADEYAEDRSPRLDLTENLYRTACGRFAAMTLPSTGASLERSIRWGTRT